jgi:hypothetical protein
MGNRMAEAKNSADYLPRKVAEFKLNQGCSRAELEQAMRQLMLAKKLVSKQVGQYSNRAPMFGLVPTE